MTSGIYDSKGPVCCVCSEESVGRILQSLETGWISQEVMPILSLVLALCFFSGSLSWT